MDIKLGEKLKTIRKNMNYTQKEFADFLNIPQPSLSAYENDRNSPTIDVLINIAKKCNISIDWLCGISPSNNKQFVLSEFSDLLVLLYQLLELKDIGVEVYSQDKKVLVFVNDRNYKHNADLCQAIFSIYENVTDFETYAITKEVYEIQKEKIIEYYRGIPLVKKSYPNLSRTERIKRHIEYLKF